MVERLLPLVTRPGSSRLASLLRILLAMLAFTRFAQQLRPFEQLTPLHWAVGVVFYLAGFLMLVGFWSRLSTAVLGGTLGFIYYGYGMWLGHGDFAHHHIYMLFVPTLLLSLSPCGASFSVDRWLAVRRSRTQSERPPAERGDNWVLWLIGFQMVMSYLFGAWDKTHLGFLSGDRMEHHYAQLFYGSDLPDIVGFHAFMMTIAVVTVVWEYALVVLLWVRKWLWWVIPANMLFHGIIQFTLPVVTFTPTMWALMLVFIDPDDFHRFLDEMMGGAVSGTELPDAEGTKAT